MTEQTKRRESSENAPAQERITNLVSALETLDAEGLLDKEALERAQSKIDELKNLHFSEAHSTIQDLREKFGVATDEVVPAAGSESGGEIPKIRRIIPAEVRRELSKAEEGILETLIESDDPEGYTSPDVIVKEVWGDNSTEGGSPGKLRTPMMRLRRKLEKFNAGKIESRSGKGYRFVRD